MSRLANTAILHNPFTFHFSISQFGSQEWFTNLQIFINYNFLGDCKRNIKWSSMQRWQGIHFRGQNNHWSILTGALVANHYIMGILVHFLHVVCRFIGNLTRGIHFWGQNKYSSILTGALVAGSYIMGHLPTYVHIVCRFIGYWARGIHFWG